LLRGKLRDRDQSSERLSDDLDLSTLGERFPAGEKVRPFLVAGLGERVGSSYSMPRSRNLPNMATPALGW